MKRNVFDIMVNVLKGTRGPKPKTDVVEGAFLSIGGEKVKCRHARRLAKRITELYDVLAPTLSDDSRTKTIDSYIKINKVEGPSLANFEAIKESISTKVSISKVSIRKGVFSSGVYAANVRIGELHKLRLQLIEGK